MKNLSLILNAVLIAAVAFLYVKVYSKKEEAAPIPISAKAAASHIVFLNSDSLMDNYNLFKTMKEKMEKKRDSLDAIFTSRGKALEREIQQYQETGANLSEADRQTREEVLSKKQQEYVNARDGIMEKLKMEEDAMTDSIHNDLVSYLKIFNKDKGYDFILGYQRGGGILLASDSLDVTKQILQGLNKK